MICKTAIFLCTGGQPWKKKLIEFVLKMIRNLNLWKDFESSKVLIFELWIIQISLAWLEEIGGQRPEARTVLDINSISWNGWKLVTRQWTNISPTKAFLKISFLFPSMDMLVPWRVYTSGFGEVKISQVSWFWIYPSPYIDASGKCM